MNELTTLGWDFAEDLLHYRDAGFDSVGVFLRKLEDAGEESAVELLLESGLSVSQVGWVGGFTGADAVSSRENLQATRRALRLCGQIDAGCLVLHSGGRNGHIRRHADRLLRDALDNLLPAAERAGVPIALEPMHPAAASDWTLLTSLESAWRLVEQYDSPWLRIAYDTYHFPLGESRWSLLEDLAPWLSVVHLGDLTGEHDVDAGRVLLGQGEAPLAGIVATLLGAGYAGPFDVKLMGPEIECCDYHEVIHHSRARVDDLLSAALSRRVCRAGRHAPQARSRSKSRDRRPGRQRPHHDPRGGADLVVRTQRRPRWAKRQQGQHQGDRALAPRGLRRLG